MLGRDQMPLSFVPRPAADQVQEPAGFAPVAEENLSPVHQEVPPHQARRPRLHRPGHPPRALCDSCHGPGDTEDQGDRVPRAAAVPLPVWHSWPGRLLWVSALLRTTLGFEGALQGYFWAQPVHRTCSCVVQATERNPVPEWSLRRWLGSDQKAPEKQPLSWIWLWNVWGMFLVFSTGVLQPRNSHRDFLNIHIYSTPPVWN